MTSEGTSRDRQMCRWSAMLLHTRDVIPLETSFLSRQLCTSSPRSFYIHSQWFAHCLPTLRELAPSEVSLSRWIWLSHDATRCRALSRRHPRRPVARCGRSQPSLRRPSPPPFHLTPMKRNFIILIYSERETSRILTRHLLRPFRGVNQSPLGRMVSRDETDSSARRAV